jgi:hypothetical protein
MYIDVEIYMTNVIKFFKENPNDLLNLVSKDKEQFFYKKVKEAATKNYEKGEDVILTHSQILDLCSEINQSKEKEIHGIQKTIFGNLFLN